MRHSLFLALAAISTQAAAADWTHFANCGAAGQQRTYWYQPGSISTQGAETLVRVRGDYSQVAGSRASSAEILWSIDCTARTFSERNRVERRADGTLVAEYSRATPVMDVHAGSVAGKLLDRVCTATS